MKKLLGLCAVAMLMACGGGSSGSGVSGSKKLSDLTAEESRKLCEYSVEAEDGPRTVTCDNGDKIEISGDEECDTASADDFPESCTATVSDAEDCFEALGDNPCSPDIQRCAALLQCAFNGFSPLARLLP